VKNGFRDCEPYLSIVAISDIAICGEEIHVPGLLQKANQSSDLPS
jgi:hypothetical protein